MAHANDTPPTSVASFLVLWFFFLSTEVKRNHVLCSTSYTIAFKSRSPASSWPLLKLLVLYFMVGFAASKSTKMAQKFLQQV